mgnify:CR=1 FL=1
MRKVKRLLALLLIMALTITQLPLTAPAEDAAEDEIVIETTENNEASTELPLLQSVPEEPATSLSMKALEKLAGGIISGVAGKSVNESFAAIFGSDSARILKALQEIKGKLDNIENQIKALSGKLDEKELRGNLDSFAEFFSDYTAPYNQLCGYQTDLADDGELTDLFMQDLYWGKNRNIDTRGMTVIAAANALGDRITMVLTGGYNVFGAFDKLERHLNHWEHQGYDMRKEYRNNIINVYALYNGMGQIACEKVIEAHQGDSLSEQNIRLQAQRNLNELKANAEKVKNMNQRCAVVEHSNIRIFRDTKAGQDLYAFYENFYVAQMTPLDLYYRDRLETTEYMQSMIWTKYPVRRPGNGGSELISWQPWRGLFEDIYKAYGGKKSLYDIFFDPKEGNFINNGQHLPKGTRFATDYYVYKRVNSTDFQWRTNVVSDKGKLNETVVLARLDFSYTKSRYDSLKISSEQFFSVNRYWGIVNQGALQSNDRPPTSETAGMISGMASSYELPYSGNITLFMEEKAGATYQWFVAKGDGKDFEEIAGETGATYTLPVLEPSMNGWMYRCAIIENAGTDEEISTLADPETLKLTGEGVPEPVTIREIGSANDLTDALEKVSDGSWNAQDLRLTANIDYSMPITLNGCSLTIDLNGHTLTVQPDHTAQPNVDPMGSTAEIAAVYADNFSRLKLTGEGALNVMAGDGVAYGVYVGTGSNVKVNAVTSAGGSKAVYATGDGAVTVDSITVAGDNAYGVGCFDSSNIKVSGDVQVTGVSSHGVYIDSESGGLQSVLIGGDVTVTGEKSRGIYLGAEEAVLSVEGSVTVTGGVSAVSAGKGEVAIKGDITAPDYAVNAWHGASITVQGNIVAKGEEATAVISSGADVHIQGNVTSSGQGGMGIYASAWELVDPAEGAKVTVDGKISAATPLRMESLPVEESEHTESTTKEDYYTFTDGSSTVWAKPGSFRRAVTYTVTFDQNGGDTEASPAAQEVISGAQVGTLPTAPARSGYTFIGWNTQANGSGTAFTAATAVTDSITVYAQWSKNSTGGGSSGGSGGTSTPMETPKTETNIAGNTATAATTVTASVDSRGYATAIVSRIQVSDAISKAKEEARKQGEGTAARLEIKVQAPAAATTAETSIPKEAVSQAAEAGIGALTISTPVASITFDANTLSTLSGEATGDVKITASKVEASSLSPEAQRTVGDRPVFDFGVTSRGKTISQFGGNVSVFVPYTPKVGEDTDAIVIYCIKESGELEAVSNCIYDPATGMISFNTKHFSQYAVGYNKVSFKDVAESAWYSKAVGFIAAREITTGTGGGNFSPEVKLTRGQFIAMLMKSYGIAPDLNTKVNFADAGNSYYTSYLAAAKRLGISAGVGNNLFMPEKEITRQEMFTLLYKVLKIIGKLPQGNSGKTLSDFSDAGDIASWAKAAMSLFVETGTVSGSDGKLSPISTSTRAEMAQVLYSLLSK